jgi:broad specificity phosphatase PhoE
MAPRIYLVRHSEGYHQLEPTSETRYLPDPLLTEKGIAMCKDFANHFPKSIHLDLICASPLRRTIQTTQYCFAENLKQTPPILLLPYAQEATDLPSDTGSDRKVVEQEFGELVDASMVEEGWTSNTGIYAPTPEALKERAGKLKTWLRARTEAEVAVVGHGNFWHYVTGEVDEEGDQTSKFLNMRNLTQCSCADLGIAPDWANVEWRSYTFTDEEDGSAKLQEESDSVARREMPNRITN